MIERERITHIMLVPSQIIAILASPKFEPGAARVAGDASCRSARRSSTSTRTGSIACCRSRFYELYGLTEGFVTILDREDAVRKAGSVGVPTMSASMRILNDDGTECRARRNRRDLSGAGRCS